MTNEDDAGGQLSGSSAAPVTLETTLRDPAEGARVKMAGGCLLLLLPAAAGLRIPHHPSQLSQRRVSGLAEKEEEEEGETENASLSDLILEAISKRSVLA